MILQLLASEYPLMPLSEASTAWCFLLSAGRFLAAPAALSAQTALCWWGKDAEQVEASHRPGWCQTPKCKACCHLDSFRAQQGGKDAATPCIKQRHPPWVDLIPVSLGGMQFMGRSVFWVWGGKGKEELFCTVIEKISLLYGYNLSSGKAKGRSEILM